MSQSIKNQSKTTHRTPKVPTKGPAMRVAVAKDVLKLMRLGMKATGGTYCNVPDQDILDELCNPVSPAALQKLIAQQAKHCHVCAKGAIVLAHIHLFDGEDGLPYGCLNEKAQDVWGVQNADLIEQAFEFGPGEGDPDTKTKLGRAHNFGARYSDSAKRLRAIMNNVIKNNGTFEP